QRFLPLKLRPLSTERSRDTRRISIECLRELVGRDKRHFPNSSTERSVLARTRPLLFQ
ncbi:hypothetical protein BaRGS_00001292, partial [Batillaria attramentaria]